MSCRLKISVLYLKVENIIVDAKFDNNMIDVSHVGRKKQVNYNIVNMLSIHWKQAKRKHLHLETAQC